MFRYIVLVLFLVSLEIVQADVPLDVQKKGEFVLRGVDDMIMRINSGICRITGKTIRSGGETGVETIQDDIMIAFDYHNRLYRFDNGVRIRTLLTPDFYYEAWNVAEHNPSVTRFSASEPKVSGLANFVDIQGIFTFTPVGPSRHYSYQRYSLHKDLADATIKTIDYSEAANGIAKITTVYPRNDNAPTISASFFVDTKNGYTVPRIEVSDIYVMDISWININNTWVPSTYRLKSNSHINVEWKIEWQIVNEKVDEKYFKVEDLAAGIEGTVQMFSSELGPSIHIGIIPEGEPPFEFADLNKTKPTYWLNRLLFGLSILLILAGLGKMAYDKWRKRHTQEK